MVEVGPNIVFIEATVLKTTEAAASVASNVAMALRQTNSAKDKGPSGLQSGQKLAKHIQDT